MALAESGFGGKVNVMFLSDQLNALSYLKINCVFFLRQLLGL